VQLFCPNPKAASSPCAHTDWLVLTWKLYQKARQGINPSTTENGITVWNQW